MNKLLATCAITLAVLSATGWSGQAAAQPAGATQTSVARSVTVKVTPAKLATSGWEFAVVLDTHSEDLKDDLVNAAVLVVEGRELQPIAWEGAPPGGHHREGVLRFPGPQTGAAAVVELRLSRPGESAARSFRWEGLQPQ